MGQNGRRNKRKKRTHMPLTIVRWVLSILLLCLIVLTFGYLDKRLNDGRIINKIIHSGHEVQVTETTETEVATEKTQPDVLTVCIDAGHGGKDNGSETDSRKEKDDTLKMAELLKKKMEAKGIKVVMTRETDDKVTLKERVATANSSGADYFISIHRNKGDGYGVESWINENPSEVEAMLGQQVHDNIVNVGVQRDRGLKQGTEGGSSGYYVVRATTMPACLVELGFINNAKDNELFDTKMSEYADAITKAVTDTYAKYGEQPDQNNVSGSTEVPSESDTQNTSESSQTTEAAKTTEAAATASATGMVLTNTQIADVSALSGETLNWGQGTNFDSLNRPGGCLGYNQKYASYSADFIQDTTDKVIYLSFDEGYEYGFTPSIINTLKEKQVPAIFFVTKPYAVKDPDLVKSIIDNGFILGNHSVTHPADGLPSETLDQQKEEIMGNHQYIKDNFGYDMCLFRFPAGKFSEQSLAIVNNCNYRSVFWSFAYMDYDVNNQPDEAASLQKLVDRLHPGAIYLLHAESKTNTDILGQFIDKAREAGYTFGYYYDTIKKN